MICECVCVSLRGWAVQAQFPWSAPSRAARSRGGPLGTSRSWARANLRPSEPHLIQKSCLTSQLWGPVQITPRAMVPELQSIGLDARLPSISQPGCGLRSRK